MVLLIIAAPPNVPDISVEFNCDVYQEDPIPVTIEWMVKKYNSYVDIESHLPYRFMQYGVAKKGVVYPEDVTVVMELNNGLIVCPYLTANDTSCTVTLPRDVYNISITQSNNIGSTVDSRVINSQCATFSNH